MNLFTNTSGSANIGFSTTIPYDISEWAKDIIAGDLNGDGVPEVVVAKGNSDRVSIYNNTLTNIYNSGVTYGPASLAITDFDGDGKPDIAVGCERSSNITILRNTGTGATLSFSKQIINTSSTVKKLAVRDMDGDGKPDIVGILPDNNSLSIMLNTYTSGNLTFTTTTFTGNAGAFHIQVSDVDGDDKPDIALSNATTKTLSVFRNTSTAGNISLDARIDYPANGTPTVLAIGDIDGDTKPEIALGDADNAIVQVFKNNSTSGAIGFTSINFATGMSAGSLLINDFNGDGKNDVAITNVNTNAIQVLRNVSNEPEITSFTPTEGDGTTTVTITGRNLNNAGNVTFGGVTAASFSVNSSTSITAIPASTGADGSISVTTPFGTAYSSGIFNFLTPPTITGFTPGYGTKGTTVTINGSNFRNVTEVTIGGVKAILQFINIPATSMQVTVGAGATGDVVVKTSDGTATKAGFTYYDKPTITSFTPTSGHYGDTIVITGTNFNGLQNATFGGYVSIYRIAESNTTIKAVVGTGATGDVLVRTLGGTATLPGFTWLPPAPIITSFTPTSGVSGTLITITGDNFTGATEVKFGGITTPYTIVNATTITATLTTGATGDVSVTGAGGTGTLAGFTFIYPVPTITSISPASASEGETVTITGTNFTNATIVSFGGTAATSFTIVSPTEIKAIVGKGSSGNVSITTPVGTAIIPGFTFIKPDPQTPVVNEPIPTELIIYPNPTQSHTSFWVKHPVFTNDTWIRVVDMAGRVVVVVKVPAGTKTTRVPVPMLKSGYYKVGMHGALLHQYKTLMIR
jgi:hypothetical protein